MRKRSIAVLTATAVLFAGLGARLWMLARDRDLAVSDLQATRTQVIATARGTLYDRYGEPLVNRERSVVASIAPYRSCIAAVRGQLVTDVSEVLARLENGERVTTTLSSWVSPMAGIVQITAPDRYDDDFSACHMIGYVNGEGDGVTGMERCLNSELRRYDCEATVSYRVDALGVVASDSEDVLTNGLSKSKGGAALTLDAQIQSLVCTAAADYLERGAVVVLSPTSGEVLASVSVPLYDPNNVAASLDDPASPLLDRTRIGYDIGSVFKILVAATALENGMSVRTAYTCTGSCMAGGERFHCHNPLGDGLQTMDEAMKNSCNCYFIQLALDVGGEAIRETAQKAGFGDSLSLYTDYATASGVLPELRDLSAQAAVANFAIGQGSLLVSPYHAAALLGAVVNDGQWVSPSVVYGMVDEAGTVQPLAQEPATRTLFSAQTAALLREMLEDVVSDGTGRAAQPTFGDGAGKTGTAQTGWEQNGEEVVQSWFAGYYPVQDPQYVIAIVSENGGQNGKTASALFAVIADALYSAGLAGVM